VRGRWRPQRWLGLCGSQAAQGVCSDWQLRVDLGLADTGFHAVAPFMRGYAPTEIPEDGCFGLAALERIQHPDQVGRQVRAGVPRRLGWVADRLPRVTMVAPDDKSPAR
jgi:hypothetical protein